MLHLPWINFPHGEPAGHPRNHLHQLIQGTHSLHLPHGDEEILEGEAALPENLVVERFGLPGVHHGLGPFHQPDDIPLLEDAAGDPLGVDRLERVDAFARADELERLSRHPADRESRTTPRVAVHLGQDEAGQVENAVEAPGDPHRLLSGHGVGDQKDFARFEHLLEARQLVHEGLVDLEPPRRVHNENPGLHLPGPAVGFPGNLDRIRGPVFVVDRNSDLPSKHPQLVHRRGTVEVAGGEKSGPALALEPLCQLGRGRGLPRALQPHQHDDRRGCRRPLQRNLIPGTDQQRQLVLDDLHDLLAGRHGLQHPFAHRLFLNALQECSGDLEVDVGLQESAAHLAQPFPDHRFRQKSALAKSPQNPVQLPAQVFKHHSPQ